MSRDSKVIYTVIDRDNEIYTFNDLDTAYRFMTEKNARVLNMVEIIQRIYVLGGV